MAEAAGIGGPSDQSDFGVDPLEARLHAADQVFHAAIGPMLIAAELLVVEVDIGDLRSCVFAIVVAAVLAITNPAIVQPVEAPGIHAILLGDFSQHVDEEVAIGAQQAKHAAIRM